MAQEQQFERRRGPRIGAPTPRARARVVRRRAGLMPSPLIEPAARPGRPVDEARRDVARLLDEVMPLVERKLAAVSEAGAGGQQRAGGDGA